MDEVNLKNKKTCKNAVPSDKFHRHKLRVPKVSRGLSASFPLRERGKMIIPQKATIEDCIYNDTRRGQIKLYQSTSSNLKPMSWPSFSLSLFASRFSYLPNYKPLNWLNNGAVLSCPSSSSKISRLYKRHQLLCIGNSGVPLSESRVGDISCHDHSAEWAAVPTEALIHVFSKLSLKDIGRSAQVCRSWHHASQFAELWQHFEFVIGKADVSYTPPTSPGLIDHVITHHLKHLKFVVFKTDSSAESTRRACYILSRLVDCPLRKLALVSSNNSKPFVAEDYTSFASAVTVMLNKSSHLQSLAIDATPVDDLSLQALVSASSPQSLHLLQMKGCSRVTPQGILGIADHFNHLRELSLSWSLLSESLIRALSSKDHTCLEYLCIDIHSLCRHCLRLDSSVSTEKVKSPSAECWRALIEHSPNLALAIHFFDGDGTNFSADHHSTALLHSHYGMQTISCSIFSSYIPVTHLYFGDAATRTILAGVARHCPRLQELVATGIIAGNCEYADQSGSLLDAELIAMANGCPQLASIGLGDCEVSCKAIVEFAGRVGPRLSRLCVNEDSLVEEGDVDIELTCRLVSSFIGQDWSPESTPLW